MLEHRIGTSSDAQAAKIIPAEPQNAKNKSLASAVLCLFFALNIC